jgi:hypothetical protein
MLDSEEEAYKRGIRIYRTVSDLATAIVSTARQNQDPDFLPEVISVIYSKNTSPRAVEFFNDRIRLVLSQRALQEEESLQALLNILARILQQAICQEQKTEAFASAVPL